MLILKATMTKVSLGMHFAFLSIAIKIDMPYFIFFPHNTPSLTVFSDLINSYYSHFHIPNVVLCYHSMNGWLVTEIHKDKQSNILSNIIHVNLKQRMTPINIIPGCYKNNFPFSYFTRTSFQLVESLKCY